MVKILLLTKDNRRRRLVDTLDEPDYKSKYVDMNGNPLEDASPEQVEAPEVNGVDDKRGGDFHDMNRKDLEAYAVELGISPEDAAGARSKKVLKELIENFGDVANGSEDEAKGEPAKGEPAKGDEAHTVVVTQEMLDEHPELVDQGAKVGDEIEVEEEEEGEASPEASKDE